MPHTQLITDSSSLVFNNHIYTMPENYIYLYHVPNSNGGMGVYLLLPCYADNVTDSQPVTFSSSTPLARSAPIYSYSNSGPRQISVQFVLHRDMMKQINYGTSNVLLENTTNDDYTDKLITYIQAAALPTYDVAQKMVNPPLVALRLGNDIYIKGVVSGSVNIGYQYPILKNGKYAEVTLGFTICEVEPYDAQMAANMGSFRGLDTTISNRNTFVRPMI